MLGIFGMAYKQLVMLYLIPAKVFRMQNLAAQIFKVLMWHYGKQQQQLKSVDIAP